MKKNPEILSQEIKNGDASAFGLFYQAEFHNIVWFVNGYLHDLQKAQDIAQESLWTLWEKREIIDTDKNIRSLAFTIARNRTINELKSRSLFSAGSFNLDEINADIMALGDHSLDEELEALSLNDLITKTMENLPDTVRDSFIKSRMEGMTNKEIAQAKNMSVTGVEYHIKISLRIFREKLKDYLIVCGLVLLLLYYI